MKIRTDGNATIDIESVLSPDLYEQALAFLRAIIAASGEDRVAAPVEGDPS